MLLFLAAAFAGTPAPAPATTPAHYHPDDVAKKSAVFGKVSENRGPAFEDRSGKIESAGNALSELELGVGLLGASAPDGLKAWASGTRRKIVGEKLRLQKHVDLLQDDYARVFTAAVDRALPTVGQGYTVEVCGASGVLAMMGRKNCPGTDLNEALAKAIDADTGLQKELADISSVEWPSFEVPKEAEPVVALTGTTRWIAGGAVADKLLGPWVAQKQNTLQSAIDKVMPDEPTKDDIAKAQALKDAYLVDLGKAGDTFRTAIAGSLARAAKKGGPADVGWCANPAALGGCPGEDVTDAVMSNLVADKKFLKEIAGFAVEGP
jgi:hypothetical protein